MPEQHPYLRAWRAVPAHRRRKIVTALRSVLEVDPHLPDATVQRAMRTVGHKGRHLPADTLTKREWDRVLRHFEELVLPRFTDAAAGLKLLRFVSGYEDDSELGEGSEADVARRIRDVLEAARGFLNAATEEFGLQWYGLLRDRVKAGSHGDRALLALVDAVEAADGL